MVVNNDADERIDRFARFEALAQLATADFAGPPECPGRFEGVKVIVLTVTAAAHRIA